MSRPIKASKPTSRAGLALIVVIVISFSWSAYALYKIAIGDAETSIFGFNVSKTPAANDMQSRPNNNQQVAAKAPNLSISEQLALYKSEIVKELLARQRELLAVAHHQQRSSTEVPDNPSLASSDQLIQLMRQQDKDKQRGGVDSNEVSQWRGGYRLPGGLENLLAKERLSGQLDGVHVAPAEQRHQQQHARLAPVRAEQSNAHHKVQLLQDAPSLGQLSARAFQVAQRQAAAELRNRGHSQARRGVERQPQESSVSEELTERNPLAMSDEQASKENEDESTATTTTTAAPLFETTTISAEQSESGPDDEDGASSAESGDDDAAGDHNDGRLPADDQLAADKVDDESLKRARKAVHAIDEEVDRMTQPSVGIISQHGAGTGHPDKKQQQLGSIAGVQFDDQPVSSIERSDRTAPPGRRKSTEVSAKRLAQISGNYKGSPRLGAAQDLDSGSSQRADRNTTRMAYVGVRGKREAHLIEQYWTSPDNVSEATEHANRRLISNAKIRISDRATESDEDDDEQPVPSKITNDRIVSPSSPSLQELLAHKQLLDSLRQNRSPSAPFTSVSMPGNPIGVGVTPTKLPANGQQVVQVAGASQGLVEHQPAADSLYTIDEGLLLTPAGNEDLEHKSMSKKKKKAKKKVAMAVKKGGHKKNEHKNEQKKYLKEKKFKGAKKGKKMSKGKGGKGGKKGSKYYKDKGFKKKGFKNIYVKNEFGQKKSYFDEFRDKNFKKKWKNFDDKYNYAQMKKWQAKDVKGAKKMKDHGEKYKKYDKGRWRKKFHREQKSESSKRKKKYDKFRR